MSHLPNHTGLFLSREASLLAWLLSKNPSLPLSEVPFLLLLKSEDTSSGFKHPCSGKHRTGSHGHCTTWGVSALPLQEPPSPSVKRV